jgi:hypothetical protein
MLGCPVGMQLVHVPTDVVSDMTGWLDQAAFYFGKKNSYGLKPLVLVGLSKVGRLA